MRGQSRQEFWLLAVLTRTPGTSWLSELKHGPCTLQPLTLIYTHTISASLICSTYERSTVVLWYINNLVVQHITYATALCYSIYHYRISFNLQQQLNSIYAPWPRQIQCIGITIHNCGMNCNSREANYVVQTQPPSSPHFSPVRANSSPALEDAHAIHSSTARHYDTCSGQDILPLIDLISERRNSYNPSQLHPPIREPFLKPCNANKKARKRRKGPTCSRTCF